ncbi:MAG: HAD hydrolase family protein [Chloroflexi bacterium]|nr:HAD hydrolase family protein [Chloroflexota bacterium]
MINQKILIVDDELGVAQPLKRALDLLPNTMQQVEICSTGEDALERLRAKHFDLLITDFRLPGMDGLTLLEQARQIAPDLLSVLISAYGSPDLEARVQKLANAFIPKPYHLRDIIKVVQKLLLSAAPPPASLPDALADNLSGTQIVTPMVERRRHTHLKILASDLDGTLARDGVVPLGTWDLLRQAKLAGITLILVTGRILENFIDSGPFEEIFEVLVAENGAVIFFPRKNQIKQPFGRLPHLLINRLEELLIPLERGMSIVATRTPHDEAILKVLQELNVGATIEYNNGAVMLLPPGATKGTGLAFALHELGYSTHNLITCGDAENDESMLELAELSVAVPNALPKIKALVDVVLPHDPEDTGTGINQLLKQLLSRRGPQHPQRPERRIVLGYTRDGAPIYIDPMNLVDSQIGIFGDSKSGKSWLSGLLVEELLRLGYQVCVIDPEGDYSTLASSTHCLHVGSADAPLPSIADLITLIEWHDVSVIMDLSTRSPEERQTYMLGFLRALRGTRTRRGRPHWTLIDEAHYFCPREGGELTNLLQDCQQDGISIGLVSYQPSQLASGLIEKLDDCLLTRLNNQAEINALSPYLSKSKNNQDLPGQLANLTVGQACLCSNTFKPLTAEILATGWHPVIFQVGPRSIPHIRHLQKYLRAPLPEHKRFYFCEANGLNLGPTAASLWEFREILATVQLNSLQYHYLRRDFEFWIRNVLGDGELANQINKLEENLNGEDLRNTLHELVVRRYDELENLM